jgi:hypothetical protein
MRYLDDVINEILEVNTNEVLNSELEKLIYDLGFKAPELHYELWNRLNFILNNIIPNPLENEETLKIVSIFTMISEEDLIKQFN